MNVNDIFRVLSLLFLPLSKEVVFIMFLHDAFTWSFRKIFRKNFYWNAIVVNHLSI